MTSETLRELAEVVGWPGARAVCALRGGQEVRFDRLLDDPALARVLGAALPVLAEYFGAAWVKVPLPDMATARRMEARRLDAAGVSYAEIARRLGVSTRHAIRLATASPDDEP
jgi:hypothetical protein